MRFAYFATTTVFIAAAASSACAADCKNLAGKTFGPASITEAGDVTAGSLLPGEVRNAATAAAPFCRVQGTIKPSADSDIKFEVWLPSTWNGKYQGTGNGGFGGTIGYSALRQAMDAGFAASNTDTGHFDNRGDGTDLGWAPGHPEKVLDWGWRASHETAVASKAIIDAYYGKAPARSYFTGCSAGGRQALMEAQRFPRDYDGIVAGAAGNYQVEVLTQSLWLVQATSKQGWLSRGKLAAVGAAVRKTCGAADGIIDDPGKCRFDPAALLCKSAETDACLTSYEVDLVRKVYTGIPDANGKPIYAGWSFGSESTWDWGPASRRFVHSTEFYRDMVIGDPKWDFQSMTIGAALAKAAEKITPVINAVNPDLSAFKSAGGKLIQYHGWSDASVPSAGAIKYHEAVVAKMGGAVNVDSFYRLFMAPGMGHCGGGNVPNSVGGISSGAPASSDPELDMVTALDLWVEKGAAPARFIATQYANSPRANGDAAQENNSTARAIVAQRPWCPHPQTAHYDGTGDRSKASSWACAAN